jgi:hypothetical protein
MHAVIRRYRVRLGTVRQVVRDAENEFLPLVRQIPGFTACYLLDAGDAVVTSIGLFQTAEGSGAAIELHRAWFRDDWSSVLPVPPEVIAGPVLAQVSAEQAVAEFPGVRGASVRARSVSVVTPGIPAAEEAHSPTFVALDAAAPETVSGTSW